MFPLILCFLAGDLYLQTFASLPSLFISCNILLLTIIVTVITHKKFKVSFLLVAFVAGFTYTLWFAETISSWTLKKEWEGVPLVATGTIASLPKTGKFGNQFNFHLEKLNYQNIIEYPDTIIKLSCAYKSCPKNLRAGDRWNLIVMLKRIHSVQSPDAHDYEAWAFQNGIRATGIIQKDQQRLQGSEFSPLLKFRQFVQEKIIAYEPHTRTSPWLMALMIGERNGMVKQDWDVLRNTGTNHLMAIGGLHIGILSGFAHFIMRSIWRRFPFLVLIIPAQKMGALAALFTAIFYASLSGFSLPTQRAAIMLVVCIIAILYNRKISPWHLWSLALASVLLFNPLAALSESFWLSFGTIALIIYGMNYRLSPEGLWWKYGRVQWVIGIGLIPLSLLFFQECSLVSFAANSIAIPWLGLTILPLCFLATLTSPVSSLMTTFLLFIADKSLAGLWWVLSFFSHYQWTSFFLSIPDIWYFIAIMIGFIMILMPAGMPCRFLGVIWILPTLMYQPVKPLQHEYWVSLLDVGQGLSLVIQTAKHILVYDTGPGYEGGMDMGESIVLPYLRKIRASKIDLMVVSHGDNDHAGGVKSILQFFPDTEIKTSDIKKISSMHASFCKSGQRWQWDGVDFTFLYPLNNDVNLGNNSSCVLLIDNGHYRVLLPGDIEKKAESDLLANRREDLKANLMVAPHHGSKTSGMEAFISTVNPQIVLYATGYRNRYHFPHQSVVETYQYMNVKAFDTVRDGTVEFKFPWQAALKDPDCWRTVNKKYWFDMS